MAASKDSFLCQLGRLLFLFNSLRLNANSGCPATMDLLIPKISEGGQMCTGARRDDI